jgi:hypothetical protein
MAAKKGFLGIFGLAYDIFLLISIIFLILSAIVSMAFYYEVFQS